MQTVVNKALVSMCAFFAVSQAAMAAEFSTIYSFTGKPSAGYPLSNLVFGLDGDLYGVSYYGGSANGGAIYKVSLTPTVTETTLYSFPVDSTQEYPDMSLTLGHDGVLYGASRCRGAHNVGSIFKFVQGVPVTMYSFTGGSDGEYPSALALAPDGSLYGTTNAGGDSNNGTVFKMTTAGEFTTLHRFAGPEGSTPWAGLTISANGTFFYGATQFGGADGNGVLFKMSLGGVVTDLYDFDGGGSDPEGTLVWGPDGNLYGTTHGGGTYGGGTIYRSTPAGAVTVLYSNPDGEKDQLQPQDLSLAADGNFYGDVQKNGSEGVGTLFEFTTKGVFTTIHTFAGGVGGSWPISPMTSKGDNLYAVTLEGGAHADGTLYRLTVTVPTAPLPPADLTATEAAGEVKLKWDASAGATSYDVYRGMSASTIAGPIASASTTSYTNSGLTNGKTYYYVVKAVNAVGISKSSNVASAKPE